MKLTRVLKVLISLVFYLGFSVCRFIQWLTGSELRPVCVVLHYHGVSRHHQPRFAKQMDMLVRLAVPVPAYRRSPLQAGKNYAAVTFDDGYQSIAGSAVPELVRTGVPATIFVVTDLLGGMPTWDTSDCDHDGSGRLISLEEIKRLPADLITIGSHTLSHPCLISISQEQAREEVFMSRENLANVLGRDIRMFSFPYGAHDSQLIDFCHDAGYERVFTILPNLAFQDPQEFVTGRIVADPTDWPLEFRLKLLGAYRWLPRAFALKRRLLYCLTWKAKASTHQRDRNEGLKNRTAAASHDSAANQCSFTKVVAVSNCGVNLHTTRKPGQ